MSTRSLLDALSHVLCLSTSTPATIQTIVATLHNLLVVGGKRDIILALVDTLKTLYGISLYPFNRATMVELGAVPALFSLVVKDGWIGVIEDATTI
uniref:Uncharacterized protein n=1 Tax=Nelumbo nucifera TaxID=4432 RepID=A0A822ZK13_NELNU|nr:TPA_asm: hypothetical protein HUJ06_001929 [Nelumbo nucifera]